VAVADAAPESYLDTFVRVRELHPANAMALVNVRNRLPDGG